MPRIVKFIKMESRSEVTKAGSRKNGELLLNGYRVFVWNDQRVLEDRADGCATLNIIKVTKLYT